PKPTISLITSSAISEPTTPASAPSTPASAQAGTLPGGGGSGNRHRYVGFGEPSAAFSKARMVVRGASKVPSAAVTSGLLAKKQASDTRYRVAKLSEPSATMSYPPISASALSAARRTWCVVTATFGLSRAIVAAAVLTFGAPTSGVA